MRHSTLSFFLILLKFLPTRYFFSETRKSKVVITINFEHNKNFYYLDFIYIMKYKIKDGNPTM